MQEKYFCVYCHTNKINGKKYIGITSQKPKNRWGGNGQLYKKDKQTKFYNAIQKYGWNNFSHEILNSNLTQDKANQLEIYYIELYDTYNKGYNMTKGGSGSFGAMRTQEFREKLRKANLGKKHPYKAKKLTDEQRKAISNRFKGNSYAKGNKYWLGKNHTNEAIEKDRIAHLGIKNGMYGKHMSEESKLKRKQTIITNNIKCHSKEVIQYDLNGNILEVFASMKQAEEKTGVDFKQISAVCRGKQKTAHGFIWKYKGLN